MVNCDKLKGIMAERGKSGVKVAKYLGMSDKTFYSHMKRGVFGSDDIEKMIDYLEIEDPMSIFFTKEVT